MPTSTTVESKIDFIALLLLIVIVANFPPNRLQQYNNFVSAATPNAVMSYPPPSFDYDKKKDPAEWRGLCLNLLTQCLML
jgi:hypothetical protein